MGMGGGSGGGSQSNGPNSDERQQALKIAQGLKDYIPNLDTTEFLSQYSTGDLNLQNWNPTYAEFADLNETNQTGRNAMLESLGMLGDVSRNGLTGVDRANAAELNSSIGQANRNMQASIMNRFNAAGAGGAGSGANLAASILGSTAAADTGAELGQKQFQSGLNQKMAAIQALGSMGGNLRSQDWSVDQARRNAIQSFNNYRADLTNQGDQQRVNNANQMSQYNLEKRQRMADQSVATRNTNLDRNNQLKQQKYSNINAQADREMAALAGAAQSTAAEQAASAQRAAGYAGLATGAAGIGAQLLGQSKYNPFGSGAAKAEMPSIPSANISVTPSAPDPAPDFSDSWAKSELYSKGGRVRGYADGGVIYGNQDYGYNSPEPGMMDQIVGGVADAKKLYDTGKNLKNGVEYFGNMLSGANAASNVAAPVTEMAVAPVAEALGADAIGSGIVSGATEALGAEALGGLAGEAALGLGAEAGLGAAAAEAAAAEGIIGATAATGGWGLPIAAGAFGLGSLLGLFSEGGEIDEKKLNKRLNIL